MLRVYNQNHEAIQPLMTYQGLSLEQEVNGEDQLSFTAPRDCGLQEEYYIRTQDNEYVVKEISSNITDTTVSVVCKINVEALKGTPIKYFETIEKTAISSLQLALSYTSEAWTVSSTLTKKRTVRLSQKTIWDVLQEIIGLYNCECKIDAINKVITLEETIGEDKGSYFMEGLNLKELDIQSDTYDLVTRIYPVGADGLTIASVNDGKDYVENTTWSSKPLAMYWEDNRYTVAENLRDDAIEKLASLAVPAKSYSCSVIDLATSAGLSVTDYKIGDIVWIISNSEGIKEKHRIVSMTSYPDEPDNNTCTLSTTLATLTDYVSQSITTSEAVALVTTSDGQIDPSKVSISGGGGVPDGGTTGQVLKKLSDTDQDVGWGTDEKGTGISITELESYYQLKTQDIQDGAVTTAKIGEAAITNAQIAEAAIGTANIQDGIITSAKIGSGEIKSANIDTAAIQSAHIEDGAIDNLKVADGAITTAKIEDGSITTAKIGDAAITTAKIDDLAVDSAKIKDLAVTTEKVADSTITTAKIANLAVESGKIADAAITTAKISDASITSAKIISLDAGLITSGTIATNRLILYGETSSIVYTINEANGSAELSKQTIDGASITKRTINADNIMAGAITTEELAAESVTADKIAAGAITADKLQANSITLGQMAPESVQSIIQEGKDYTDSQVSYYGQFLTFDTAEGLTIGSNETNLKTVINSEEVGFYDGTTKKAYITGDGFFMTNGKSDGQFQIGHWIWYPQQDNSLSLVWKD